MNNSVTKEQSSRAVQSRQWLQHQECLVRLTWSLATTIIA